MATLNSVFTDIANAIRSKNGQSSSTKYTPENMAAAISAISSGSEVVTGTQTSSEYVESNSVLKCGTKKPKYFVVYFSNTSRVLVYNEDISSTTYIDYNGSSRNTYNIGLYNALYRFYENNGYWYAELYEISTGTSLRWIAVS